MIFIFNYYFLFIDSLRIFYFFLGIKYKVLFFIFIRLEKVIDFYRFSVGGMGF